MMKEINCEDLANARVAFRTRQALLLVVIILVGIMISTATQAQPPRHFKAKYACEKLSKKRNKTENTKVLQVSAKKIKYEPMAEVDSPKNLPPTKTRKAEDQKKL